MSEMIRKPYTKPTVEVVSLVPDEAVLGGCKTDTGGGLGYTGSTCANLDAPCSTEFTS